MQDPTQLPAYFDARDVIRKAVAKDERPKLNELVQVVRTFLKSAQTEAMKRELVKQDTSHLRAILTELSWWVGATVNADEILACLGRATRALGDRDPLPVTRQDKDGSFGHGVQPFFLKLDRSTDQLIDGPWPGAVLPRFLAPIATPELMVGYLDKLRVSNVTEGVDKRKELNLASAVISRLALWGGQAGYLEGEAFVTAFRDFLWRWQDKETGFFCVSYLVHRFHETDHLVGIHESVDIL
jgi:hypothetical protein